MDDSVVSWQMHHNCSKCNYFCLSKESIHTCKEFTKCNTARSFFCTRI